METDHNFIVQEILERTTAWLNEVKILKLLQDNEISLIVKTRTDYEYKLLASRRTKDLYLRYAQYELNLLTLVKTRMEKLGIRMLNRHMDALKHVESIFKRAISFDKKDVYMWKTYIDFCVKYNYHVENALEGAVRTNPMSPDVWILAAKWQLEVNQSEESARYLFQRAVKLNKESEKLWLEFFKLEAILARAEATDGVEVVVDVDSEVASKYKDEKAQLDLYAIPMLVYKQVTQATTLRESHNLRFEMLKILSHLEFTNHLQNFILRDIMLNFRENEECIFKCITIELDRFIDDLNDQMNSSKRKKNKNAGTASVSLNTITQIYNNGVHASNSLLQVLKAIPTQKMWLLYSRLCLRLFHLFHELAHPEVKNEENEEDEKPTPEQTALEYSIYFWKRLFNEIYPTANKSGLMGADMLCDYCNLLSCCNKQRTLLLNTLQEACETVYPHSADLWILYMTVTEGKKSVVDSAIAKYTSRPPLPKESKEFAHEAQQQIKFWKHVLQYMKKWINHLTIKELDHYFIQAIKYCSHSHEMKKLFFRFYSKTYPFEGKTEAIRLKRKFEKLESVLQILLSLPPNSAEIYRILIAYFTAQLKNSKYSDQEGKREDDEMKDDDNESETSNEDDDDDERDMSSSDHFDIHKKSEQILAKLYSRAITDHGREEEDFWLHYIVMMKRQGNLQKVQNLHYQATKTLKDSNKVQSFLEKYDLLK